MENQHSKNIAMIVFSLLFLYACTETGNSKQTPKSQESAQTLAQKPIVKKIKAPPTIAKSEKDSLNNSEITSGSEAPIKKQKPKSEEITKEPTKPKSKLKKKKKLYPKIEFENEVYDFGEITEGDTINYKFKFKNSGKSTLEIKSASATCGCTQPSYPFIGVDPGDEGTISVRYISVGKSGPQEATITVKSNADFPTKKLLLKGIVNDKIVEIKEKKDSSKLDTKH